MSTAAPSQAVPSQDGADSRCPRCAAATDLEALFARLRLPHIRRCEARYLDERHCPTPSCSAAASPPAPAGRSHDRLRAIPTGP